MADKKRFALDGYVDVPTRLRMALEDHPDLRVMEDLPTVRQIGDRTFIEVTVRIWRDPSDTHPVVASCWEPFPGQSPYTKNSEMMNCSTSAIGRALGMMCYGIRASLATVDEIENRRNEMPTYQEPDQAPVSGIDRPPSDAQLVLIGRICEERGITELPAITTRKEASTWIKEQTNR